MKLRYFLAQFKRRILCQLQKPKNETYRLRIYIPEEVKASLGIDKKVIENVSS